MTPVNSKDHNDDNHELLMKIHSGLELEESDWEQIEHEKVRDEESSSAHALAKYAVFSTNVHLQSVGFRLSIKRF